MDEEAEYDYSDERWNRYSYERPVRKVILVIDDTLDIELKKHRLLREDSYINNVLNHNNLDILHVHNKEEALNALEYLKRDYQNDGYDPVPPENVTIVSDYKIQQPGRPEEWGPDVLEALSQDPTYKPSTIFLMSKSGFRDEDKPKLEKLGAQYFHTNEFFFTAAAQQKNEALMEVFSQRATTHVFRDWFNKQFDTTLPLTQYRSPNVNEVEKDRLPVDEVVRRIKANEVTHAEAMQLIDEHSVRAAFRSTVDTSGIAGIAHKKIEHGIEGPSASGRVAFSEGDVARIRAETPNAKIILVLDHDYSPADHSALSKANGIIMLKSGTQHIQIWAKDARFPVLFANKEKYTDFSIKDGALLMHDGVTAPTAFANAGDWITIDGTTLTAYAGQLPIKEPAPEKLEAAKELARIGDYNNRLTWHFKNSDYTLTDRTGTNVMVNASSSEQIASAKTNPGVSGVGLLRTEPMFNTDERRLLLLKALLCEGAAKSEALDKLTELHTHDLEPVFAQQNSHFPINVRLFDFPPAEFFPNPEDEKAIYEVAKALHVDADKIKQFSRHIYDSNLRGAGFSLEYSEILKAQCNAIFAAAANHSQTEPRILVPAIRNADQMSSIKKTIKQASEAHGSKPFQIGAMIETRDVAPRSYDSPEIRVLQDVVQQSDFLCLGTNDLTEELLDVKRGDIVSQIKWSHQTRSAIKPFDELAPDVVKALDEIIRHAKQVKPDIPITLCGDQATSRSSAVFCQEKGIQALSVPATKEQEAITQALVETGRASLIEAMQHREIIRADMKAREDAQRDREVGKLPGNVTPVVFDTLVQSPIAFIIIEDEGEQRVNFQFNLKKLPVLLCENISDGLKAAEAMRKQGKEVHIYTDANVGAMSYQDRSEGTAHPDCTKFQGNDRTPAGIKLIQAIANSGIDGLSVENVSLMSAFNIARLPAGVREFSKLNNIKDQLKRDMLERIEAAELKAKEKPKADKVVAGKENTVNKMIDQTNAEITKPKDGFTGP